MRLVIFDVDGTIIDSAAEIVHSMHEVFANNKLPIPDAKDIRAGIGRNLELIMLHLIGGEDRELSLKLADEYRESFNYKIENGLLRETLYDGAEKAIETLGAEGETLLGIATGKQLRGVERIFRERGFGHHFQTVQTPDNNPSKPHPGMVLSAIGETGVAAERTVMIGDTSYDMEMAKAAGAKALGVSWGYHSADKLVATGADMVIDEYGQLFDAINELIG